MRSSLRSLTTLVLALALAAAAHAGGSFQDLVGAVERGPVRQQAPLRVPFITWGGDLATFHGNGGLRTRPGSIFAEQGLDLELVPGDDFVGQVRDYLAGRSPFLRGTFRMMGMASEVIGATPAPRES